MTGRIGIVSRLIFAAFLLCAGLPSAAHAEKRVALVIGNSAYQSVPRLPNPDADAKLMSDTLLSLGFFVVGGSAQARPRQDPLRCSLAGIQNPAGRRRRRAVLLRRPWCGDARVELSGAGRRPSAGRSRCLFRDGLDLRHSRPARKIRHADQSGAARCLPRQPVLRAWRAFNHRRLGANAGADRDF